MAEVAALVAAEEVISTTVQAGAIAGYAVAKATLPLKASLFCFGTSSDKDRSSLHRSGHTVSVVNHNAYIFGGLIADDTLAGSEIHVVRLPDRKRTQDVVQGQGWEYKAVPAIPAVESGDVPPPRTEHTACVVDEKIYIFGGRGLKSESLVENGRVWVFDTESMKWSYLDPPSGLGGVFPTLYLHAAGVHKTETSSSLVVLGGLLPDGSLNVGVWEFDLTTSVWRTMQTSHMPATVSEKSMPLPPNMVIAHHRLYTITGSSELHSSLHCLDLSRGPDSLEWETSPFPSNALTPGPRPRRGGGLLHIALGQGREYLLFFFGAKAETSESSSEDKIAASKDQELPTQWSDIWAYQLPSDKNTSASLKDKIRANLPGGIVSREGEWAEVEIITDESDAGSGATNKAHPGPRAFFAASAVNSDTGGYGIKLGEKADSAVLWGGIDPNSIRHGDGWEIKLTL